MGARDYNRPPRPPDLEAEITLLPAEQGGRSSPAFSGYRPSHNFDVPGTLNDAMHEYVDGSLRPGDTGRALLGMMNTKAMVAPTGFEPVFQP
jgi:translation elongation factor EF-Tu-like GTPase